MSAPEVTFITRHYPPNPNINGEAIRDLVFFLEQEHGIKSNVVTTNKTFEGGGSRKKPTGSVNSIKTIYNGKNSLLRFIAMFYDGYFLLKRALSFKNTFLVCTTSPPLLPFWASVFIDSRKWALWTFDLFPEGFEASGKVNRTNPFYKWILKRTYKNPPDFLITLGEMQLQFIERKYQSKIDHSIVPCGAFAVLDKSPIVPGWKQDTELTYLGYCGNIGDPHNPEFLYAIIDQINPNKHRLILALYGNQATNVKAYAKGREGVVITEIVPRNQLYNIDIHLVSLRSSWTHIAVPSKAVSAITQGGTILFCGSKESDNWNMFKQAGWLIEESLPIKEQVKRFFSDLNKEDLAKKKKKSSSLLNEMQQKVISGYNLVANRIKKDK